MTRVGRIGWTAFAIVAAWSGLGDVAFVQAQEPAPAGPESSPDLPPQELTRKGWSLCEAGRCADAIDSFLAAIAAAPDFAPAHLALGIAQARIGRNAEAVGSLEEAARLRPGLFEAHYNLGVAYERADEHEKAARALEKAVAIKPESAIAHYNLGVALAALGRLGEAAAAYERAAVLQPDHADALANLGGVLGKGGRFPEPSRRFSASPPSPRLPHSRKRSRWITAVSSSLH